MPLIAPGVCVMLKTESTQRRCDDCGKPTRHERTVRHANHILHFIISLCTLGAWVPVWIFLSLTPDKDPWRCSACGQVPAGEKNAFIKKVGLSLAVGIPAVLLLAYLVSR